MKKFIILACLVLFLCIHLSCRADINQKANPDLKRSEGDILMASFETVWQTVNENHYDPTFGGVDWNEIYERYRKQVAQLEYNDQFIELANKMLKELKLSHYVVFDVEKSSNSGSPLMSEGTIGLETRIIKGRAIAKSVKPGSPAFIAGLRQGCEIKMVDSVPIAQMIEEAKASHVSHFNDRVLADSMNEAILNRFFGDAGSSVLVTFLDANGTKQQKEIIRKKRPHKTIIDDNFPAVYVDFESKVIKGNIGYIYFDAFFPPVDAMFSKAIDSMQDINGLIIDIRGNPGGMHEVGEAIASKLVNERILFSVFKTRDEVEEVYIEPAGKIFNGPVVILIDVMNGSASERFSACIQSIGRAVVVGEWSPGSVGPSDIKKLPNGASFMFLIAQSLTPDGTVLEGYGVKPDIMVSLDRDELLSGIDAQLERAILYIRDNSK
jgi:C-terminal peptidase prc